MPSHSPVYYTSQGTPYLRKPGVALIGQPAVNLSPVRQFLADYDPTWGQYLEDDPLPGGERLAKFAGQLCYLSFGEKRTKNADAQKYFDNIKNQAHGSIVEHSNYSFLLYGISRSLTHELVRHRTLSFSQVSQRYVDRPRFVEREEIAAIPHLHQRFEEKIDRTMREYETYIRSLEREPSLITQYASPTERRKAIRQIARDELPNCTEAPMVITGNVRSFRHIIEMRGSIHADTQIQSLAKILLFWLQVVAPRLFSDYTEGEDGITTPWRKI